MDAQTANDLTQVIREVGHLKIKFAALEQILANERPSLYASYLQGFESLRTAKAHETFLVSLDNLTKRLQAA